MIDGPHHPEHDDDRREPPDPEGGEQNRDYRNGDEKGVDDDGCAVG